MRNFIGLVLIIVFLFTLAVRGIQFLSDIIEWLNRMSKLKHHQPSPSPAVAKSTEEMRREVEQFVHEQSPFRQEPASVTYASSVPKHPQKRTKTARSKHVNSPDLERISTGFSSPLTTAGTATSPQVGAGAVTEGIFHWFDSPQSIQTAVVMSEILRRPEW